MMTKNSLSKKYKLRQELKFLLFLLKNYNKNAIISSHKNAGHIFEGNGVLNIPNMRIRLGGTSDGNKKAKLEEEKVINDFLNQYH